MHFKIVYVPNKSTEISITRITTNLLININNTYGIIIVLLSLIASFDTIDHIHLISRLYNVGITGNTLKWFTSYIYDRTSYIISNGHISSPRNIFHGIPQGSVLGPIICNIYLLPIFNIFLNTLISVHLYAYDIQLNVKCIPDLNVTLTLMYNCITFIHHCLSNTLYHLITIKQIQHFFISLLPNAH